MDRIPISIRNAVREAEMLAHADVVAIPFLDIDVGHLRQTALRNIMHRYQSSTSEISEMFRELWTTAAEELASAAANGKLTTTIGIKTQHVVDEAARELMLSELKCALQLSGIVVEIISVEGSPEVKCARFNYNSAFDGALEMLNDGSDRFYLQSSNEIVAAVQAVPQVVAAKRLLDTAIASASPKMTLHVPLFN